jgi:hypothetical protein
MTIAAPLRVVMCLKKSIRSLIISRRSVSLGVSLIYSPNPKTRATTAALKTDFACGLGL